jgi:hypothetical protein
MLGVAHDAYDVGLTFCNAKCHLVCACAVDERERAAGIDHQRSATPIHGSVHEQVVAESALQRRSAKPFALQECFQCSWRGSSGAADQRWEANNDGNCKSEGELFHGFI